GDRERNAIDQRVSDVDELHMERAGVDDFPRLDGAKLRLARQVMLLEAPLDEGERERRGVDRHIELGEEGGNGPDVVLMPVGQEGRADALAIFDEPGEVRRDDIYAEQLGFREHHAAVDDDDVVAIAQREDVHPELAESAEWDHL